MKDELNEWDTHDWLVDARNLTNWSNSIEGQDPFMLLVRHSHRESISTLKEMSETGITTLGEAMAREFGRRLPTNRSVRILHSPIPRCKQTAEEIASGIRQKSGNVQSVNPFYLLLGPVVIDAQVWEKVGNDGAGVGSFVTSWARGEYDGIEPFEEFSRRLVSGTVDKLISSDPGLMYIYVTHDLLLMGARKIFLNEEAHNDQRPPYLGGFGLSFNHSQVFVHEARTAETRMV
ncbi:MAG: histidine phosphatase family protein [Candidatus Thorarchaeota archaeon]